MTKEPIYYCPNHGNKMIVEHVKRFNIVTGIKEVQAFISKCPKFFCGYTILTGVVPNELR